MSNTPTISSSTAPPEPTLVAEARSAPPPSVEEGDAAASPGRSQGLPEGRRDHTARWLREELAGTTDKARQSRLLAELANLAERANDEPGAARDYLAAYNADPTFREPLEALIRLLEKRRSLRNLGRLVDALLRAATTPDEKVRALLMRAFYEADVSGEVPEAQASAREATDVEGARGAEQAAAWLTLEVLAGRTGDARRTRGGTRETGGLRERARVEGAAAGRPRASGVFQGRGGSGARPSRGSARARIEGDVDGDERKSSRSSAPTRASTASNRRRRQGRGRMPRRSRPWQAS